MVPTRRIRFKKSKDSFIDDHFFILLTLAQERMTRIHYSAEIYSDFTFFLLKAFGFIAMFVFIGDAVVNVLKITGKTQVQIAL